MPNRTACYSRCLGYFPPHWGTPSATGPFGSRMHQIERIPVCALRRAWSHLAVSSCCFAPSRRGEEGRDDVGSSRGISGGLHRTSPHLCESRRSSAGELCRPPSRAPRGDDLRRAAPHRWGDRWVREGRRLQIQSSGPRSAAGFLLLHRIEATEVRRCRRRSWAATHPNPCRRA
jgi:hypothetical protein